MEMLSVVIITRNECVNIQDCIASARLVSDDIVVVDAASTDNTVLLAREAGAKVVTVQWENFGQSRNTGAAACRYNWVFSLDADERITPELALQVKTIPENASGTVYGFSRRSFFAGKKIRFGTWGRDHVSRIYDRRYSSWDTTPVHEKLMVQGLQTKRLGAGIIHYPVKKEADFTEKIQRYAALTAQKYFIQKKTNSRVKRLLAPLYVFVQSYLILLGFLDGKEGYIIARQLARYTRLKYLLLTDLQNSVSSS